MRYFLFLLSFSFSFSAFAAGFNRHEEKYAYYSQNAYSITMKLCKDWSSPFQFTFYGIKHISLNDPRMVARMSPELSGLIESEGYFHALRECYGEDTQKWNTFTLELFLADNVGKFGSLFFPVPFFNFVTSRLLLTGYALSHPILVKNILRASTVFSVVSLTLVSAKAIDILRKEKLLDYFYHPGLPIDTNTHPRP